MSFEHTIKIAGPDPERNKKLKNNHEILLNKNRSFRFPYFEKTPRDIELINFGLESARDLLEERFSVKRASFPAERVFIVDKEELESHGTGTHAVPVTQQMFIESDFSDLHFTIAVAHEWFHLTAPMMLYAQNNNEILLPTRQGLSITKNKPIGDTKPQTIPTEIETYESLDLLNEAIVGRLTKLVFYNSFLKNSKFRQEISATNRIKEYINKHIGSFRQTLEEKKDAKDSPEKAEMASNALDLLNDPRNITSFDHWEEIIEMINNKDISRQEVIKRILRDILLVKVAVIEGHFEDREYLDRVMENIVAHNVARGSKVKEAKTIDGVFKIFVDAYFSGDIKTLIKKLAEITGKKDYFRSIAEGVVPKV